MKTKLLNLLLAGAALGSAPLVSSCTGTTHAYVVSDYDAPPAPRQEYAAYRPGYVFIQGNWTRYGGDWRWQDGYYVRERPGYVYQEGRWDRRGRNYVWINGTWRSQGGVVVRNHRRW